MSNDFSLTNENVFNITHFYYTLFFSMILSMLGNEEKDL